MENIEKINYAHWSNCYRLSNELIELVVVADVGPRIIRFGFIGNENEFAEFFEAPEEIDLNKWNNYGGHRLWHAPEHPVRTYYPDNEEVKVKDHGEFLRVSQPVEKTTGIQKELDIFMDRIEAKVKIIHRLYNRNMWDVKLAPWALSVMAVGGVAVIPLPPRGLHTEELLPSNTLTLWAYTDMSDHRWTWGHNYILLRQDVDSATPQKVGVMALDGKMAYARNDHLFVKIFSHSKDTVYPDLGSSAEIFTNDLFLELETVGPFINLEPEMNVEHVEYWYLFDNVPTPVDELDVEKYVKPKLELL
jgi:hypothetical protein